MNKILKMIFEKEFIGIGRRKQSTARVYIKPGIGKFIVNNVDGHKYFQFSITYLNDILKPFKVLNLENSYDVVVLTRGGGLMGQANSIKLGISRLLCKLNTNYRVLLKQNKLLKRDPRVKERKKYGLKKARKAPQYSKR